MNRRERKMLVCNAGEGAFKVYVNYAVLFLVRMLQPPVDVDICKLTAKIHLSKYCTILTCL